MDLSKFGKKFNSNSGILELMDDLDAALNGPEKMLFLGGGNPAFIPEVQSIFRKSMDHILSKGDRFERAVGVYDNPQGSRSFLKELAKLLHKQFGWNVTERNLAITNGSQNSSFYLFNLLAGEFDDGRHKQVLLPLVPEYIGYADQGLSENLFLGRRPLLDIHDDHTFKYRVDFDNLNVNQDIAALVVSRPTNPTGNVLTDDEILRLSDEAAAHNIPLIIDNAYGLPFPGVIFAEAQSIWNENIILTMSLSKLGLPGVRTGIILAQEEVITAVTRLNAVINLACGGFGPALAEDLVKSGDILRISQDYIQPFYKKRSHHALKAFHEAMDPSLPYYIHASEGAFFLWVWFKDLPITAAELYNRLKARGVIIVPGHYYYPGFQEDWKHVHECIRVSFVTTETDITHGIEVIAEEVKSAYTAGSPG